MKTLSNFQKISENIYQSSTDSIILPRRATVGSAGYDFFAPCDISLAPNETTLVKTGIRAFIENGYVLMLFPRSGLGFKYRLRLDNTVGIIDSDYYFSSNEGHIIVKLTNCGDKPLFIQKSTAFCQGIFLPFGITLNDDADGIRDGGFGSTEK
ncbi:MAG: deoxyuridine 5'-triphosphate nucleotidohydrolase [Clostridia bacterium]